MLSALSSDLVQCGHEVHTCLDRNVATSEPARTICQQSPKLVVHEVAADWLQRWTEIALRCDRIIVIAPELQQQLEQIVTGLRTANACVVASTAPFIQATSDKLVTAQWMEAANVPHPTTWSLIDFRTAMLGHECSDADAMTLKRRDGAGCSGMMHFENKSSLREWLVANKEQTRIDDHWIVQRWQQGIAASMAIIAGEDWQLVGSMEQTISVNAHSMENVCSPVVYQGGTGPIESVSADQLKRLLEQVRDALPDGANGWIGIDFVIPSSQEQALELVFIELNPRLTTSYLGYRQWYGPRLADCLLGNLNLAEVKRQYACPMERISFTTS